MMTLFDRLVDNVLVVELNIKEPTFLEQLEAIGITVIRMFGQCDSRWFYIYVFSVCDNDLIDTLHSLPQNFLYDKCAKYCTQNDRSIL